MKWWTDHLPPCFSPKPKTKKKMADRSYGRDQCYPTTQFISWFPGKGMPPPSLSFRGGKRETHFPPPWPWGEMGFHSTVSWPCPHGSTWPVSLSKTRTLAKEVKISRDSRRYQSFQWEVQHFKPARKVTRVLSFLFLLTT